MIKEYPNYYPDFHCIAGACTETCCAGWEVDLDEEAVLYYQNIAPAPFGDVVRSHIKETEDGDFIFPLRENGRCPFLNDDNLCDIIINLGESRICRTCTEHPRFVVEVDNYLQHDLSLSCPEAARLFFNDDLKFEVLREEWDDEFLDDEPYTDNEEFVECLELRDAALKLLNETERPLKTRLLNVEQMVLNHIAPEDKHLAPHLTKDDEGMTHVKASQETDAELLDLLTCMDKLDDRWEADMDRLKTYIPDQMDSRLVTLFWDVNSDLLLHNFDKISMYLAFRYFPDAYYDESPVYGLNMLLRSMHLIYLLAFSRWCYKQDCAGIDDSAILDLPDLKDLCHSYSKEVEHDDKNIAALKGL